MRTVLITGASGFIRPAGMAEAFRGVDLFVNSYYVRFNFRAVRYASELARHFRPAETGQ